MPDVYYPGIVAGDSASITDTGAVEAIVKPNTNFYVYELADTTFSTPLTIKTPAGLTDTKVPVGALPILPDVYVVSPNFAHNWKSGSLVFRRDSEDLKDKAVADSVAAAQAAVQAVPVEVERVAATGAFKGDAGKDGSNVLPTDTAIKQAIETPTSQTRTALNATVAGSPVPRFAAADNILYVSKGGNNTNDGRAPGSAKASIQSAINTLAAFGAHGEVRVGAGVFTENVILHDGISVVGAGSNMTTIKPPAQSTALGAVTIAPGPVTGMRFQGFRIEGNGNAGQHGIYARGVARPAPAYGDAGWWYSRIVDIAVVGFTGRGIWLRGGGASYLLPHQFLKFELVRVFTTKSANKEALVLSGQVGQIDWTQCQFDSNETAPYGATMTVPNVLICAELNDGGSFADDTNPYAITFRTPTLQGGWKAVYATRQCSGIEFINTHLEGFKYGFHADANATLALKNGSFNNVGNGDGTGYWGHTTVGGTLNVDGVTGGGSKDKTWTSDGNVGSLTNVRSSGSKVSTGTDTTNLTKQVSVGATGIVALQGSRTVICSTSATAITAITSNATPGEPIFIEAFNGPLTFTTGGGLHLGGKTTIKVPERTVAQFVRMDLLNAWAFVGSIAAEVKSWTKVTVFEGAWTSVGGVNSDVQYRLSFDGAHVELAGQLATGAANSVAFVLPAGFRPTKTKTLSAYSIGNGGGRGIQIGAEGNVTVLAGVTGPISLDGLVFPIDG